jgi:hypothetical protein
MKHFNTFRSFHRLQYVSFALLAVTIFASCNSFNTSPWNVDAYINSVMAETLIVPSNAGDYSGKKTAVIGIVKSTYCAENQENKPIFINLDNPFPDNQMTVYLVDDDVKRMNFDRFYYEGKRVVVTGVIKQYKDEFGKIRPSIQLTDLSQISLK